MGKIIWSFFWRHPGTRPKTILRGWGASFRAWAATMMDAKRASKTCDETASCQVRLYVAGVAAARLAASAKRLARTAASSSTSPSFATAGIGGCDVPLAASAVLDADRIGKLALGALSDGQRRALNARQIAACCHQRHATTATRARRRHRRVCCGWARLRGECPRAKPAVLVRGSIWQLAAMSSGWTMSGLS